MENIIKIPPLDYVPDFRGIGYFYYDNLLKHKNKIAQLDGKTGNTDTYDSLLKRCIQTAIFLRKLNVGKNDFISICSFNHLDSCTPLIASFFINAITSAVDPSLSSDDITILLKQTKPKVIFVLSEVVNIIEKVVDNLGYNVTLIVFGETDKYIPFSQVLKLDEEVENFKPMVVENLTQTALVYFSSGTSGLPKPICHNHYALMLSYENNRYSGYNYDMLFGFYTPYWTLYSHGLGTCISQGTTLLILPKFDPLNPWEPFHHKVTTVVLNVYQAIKLISIDKPTDVDTSSVSVLSITGGLIADDQIIKVKSLFPKTYVTLLYGQSEVAGYLTQFPLNNFGATEKNAKKNNSVGTGVPGNYYRVVDIENGTNLGPYQKGELRVKSKCELNGYYNIELSDTWDSDGWLKTGDIAYYDEEYCFYIADRLKEMFKCKGFHVIPASLEAILLQHPAVSTAVVMGVRHRIDGHCPAAIVALKPNFSHVSGDDIKKFIDDKVQDREKFRAGIRIVDSIPLTGSGKVDRQKLKELFMKEFEQNLTKCFE